MQTNAEVLNAIRNEASDAYRQSVPVATPANYAAVADALADNNYATFNEFLTTLANKILVQRVFDPVNWRFPFREFVNEIDPYGDAQELIGLEVDDATEYSLTSQLLEVKPPQVFVNYIKTTSKLKWKTSLAYDIVKGAIIKEYTLTQFANVLMRRMRFKSDKVWYDKTLEDLATIPYTAVVGNPDSDEAAKSVMTNIIGIVSEMSIPNKKYNAGNYDMALPVGDAILILNGAAKANLDVRVFASLLNSQRINDSNYFRNVYVANFADPNTLGYIVEASSYLIVPRIDQAAAFYDPDNMVSHMYLHVWTRQGLNPESQMVKLLIAEPASAAAKSSK